MKKFLLLGTIFVATSALAFGGIGIGPWQRHKNSGVDAIGVHIDPNGKKADIKIVDEDETPAIIPCGDYSCDADSICVQNEMDEFQCCNEKLGVCCDASKTIYCTQRDTEGNCLSGGCCPYIEATFKNSMRADICANGAPPSDILRYYCKQRDENNDCTDATMCWGGTISCAGEENGICRSAECCYQEGQIAHCTGKDSNGHCTGSVCCFPNEAVVDGQCCPAGSTYLNEWGHCCAANFTQYKPSEEDEEISCCSYTTFIARYEDGQVKETDCCNGNVYLTEGSLDGGSYQQTCCPSTSPGWVDGECCAAGTIVVEDGDGYTHCCPEGSTGFDTGIWECI